MSNQYTRKILFAIFVIAVVSSSCGSPRFTTKEIDLDDDELQALNSNVAGTYKIDHLLELSDSHDELERQCEPPAYWLSSRTETLSFKDNKLIISDGEETQTYVHQNIGTQDFCRKIDNGRFECISNLEKDGYSLTIYEGKHDLRICFSGTQVITRIDEPQITESQSEDAVYSNDEGSQDGQFSGDDCSFCGLSIPLSSSSASNNTYKMGVTSEVQVEVMGHLTCDWQEDYKSENKTATIMIYLNVYKFNNAQDAQLLFNKYHNDAASKIPYCEDDGSCTVVTADFGEDRAFYVFENIYVGGRGELPSDHGANLARLITTAENYYVFDLLVTHPELEIGDAWVSDKAESVEACVMNIINR